MKTSLPLVCLLAGLMIYAQPLISQTCSGSGNCTTNSSVPQSFTIEEDGSGNCRLVFTYPSDELPVIACNGNTPASGSDWTTTPPSNPTFIDFEINISGVDYIVYDRGGGNCNGAVTNLAYHPSLPNTVVTNYSTDFCIYDEIAIAYCANGTGMPNTGCEISNESVRLAVEFELFEVTQTEDGVNLEWRISTDETNFVFEVQKSYDGISFHSINLQEHFNSNKSFNFLDDQLNNVVTYYRIKTRELSGESTFTPIKVVQPHKSDIKISPTLAIKHLTLTSTNADYSTIKIYDANGRLYETFTVDFSASATHDIAIDHLEGGMYFLHVTDGRNKITVHRFIRSYN